MSRLLAWLLRRLNPCRHRWVSEPVQWSQGGNTYKTVKLVCHGCGEELTW